MLQLLIVLSMARNAIVIGSAILFASNGDAQTLAVLSRREPCTPTKVLVGLLGSVEIPFVVRRVGVEWRVEPQPYFLLIEQ